MPKIYTGAKLIIGEGITDRAFFTKLLLSRGMTGFEIDQATKTHEDQSGGIDKMGQHLRLVAVQEDFIQNIKSIVLVSDNDDGNAFKRVCIQVEEAGYNVPDAPQQMVKTPHKPEIGILLIPPESPGCLETLCFNAAKRKWPDLGEPLRQYIDGSPASTWSTIKQSKSAVECILAVVYERNPDVRLADIWQKDPQYHIPLDDGEFDYIVEFLGFL
jgi:hypothetical protein